MNLQDLGPRLGLRLLREAGRMSGRSKYADDSAHRAWAMKHLMPPVSTAMRLTFAPSLRVLAHPGRPSPNQLLAKLCALSGYRIVFDETEPYDVAVHTMKTEGVCRLPADQPVLNRRCVDVSKSHVAKVFGEVFGYDLSVDPLTFEGRIVEKSEDNYRHDGRILQGPLHPADVSPDKTYQRLVDAERGEVAVDLRTSVIGGRICSVVEKHSPRERRFESIYTFANALDPEDAFSAEEQERLVTFADRLGLDLGEFDVLRDRNGRIYVVDVNNRPSAPTKELPPAEQRRILDVMEPAFSELIERTLAQH